MPPPLPAQEGEEEEGAERLQGAGVRLGSDMLLHLTGLLRGGRDRLQAEAKVTPATQQLALRKVNSDAVVVWREGSGAWWRLAGEPGGDS